MRAACVISLMLAAAAPAPVLAQEFFTLKGHGGPIMDVAVSPAGQIATASFDNAVGLWDGTAPRWFDGHEAAVSALSFAGEGTVISGGDDFAIRIWPSGAVLGRHTAKVTDIEVQGGLVATASWDRTARIWRKGASGWEGISLEGHDLGVNDVVFGDGGRALYSASADGTIRLWDTATGAQRALLASHGFGVNTLALSEAEGWLAYGASDGGTRLIDLATGAAVADFTLDRRPVLSMAYDAASRQLAVGDGQGHIMIIDTAARRIARDFKAARNGPIWALAFSADGQNLHAGGIEDTVYSWPVATMTEHGQMATTTRSFLEDPKTLPNGERQFKRKCSICHTLTANRARRAGPSLHRIFGKPAGTQPGYSYSDTLDGSKIVWSAETINDLFEIGPDDYIPGSKMPMQRIALQKDREDLIDYLRQATAAKGE